MPHNSLRPASKFAIPLAFLALPVFADAPVTGAGGDILSKVGEVGSATLAIVMSLYWLRDSMARRIEEAKEYAESIRRIEEDHRKESLDMRKALERAYLRKSED